MMETPNEGRTTPTPASAPRGEAVACNACHGEREVSEHECCGNSTNGDCCGQSIEVRVPCLFCGDGTVTHPPAASGVTGAQSSGDSGELTHEPVSDAYTLPDTVQAIIDAAAAYEKKHGAWQDYRMSKRDDAFPVDKTERSIIVAYRQYTAALTASRGGG